MKSWRPLTIALILAISSLACFNASTQSSASNILFFDDFSSTGNKWDQVTESNRSTSYYNGAYRITVNEADSHAWANPKSGIFTDAPIEVDATKNGGPDNNSSFQRSSKSRAEA